MKILKFSLIIFFFLLILSGYKLESAKAVSSLTVLTKKSANALKVVPNADAFLYKINRTTMAQTLLKKTKTAADGKATFTIDFTPDTANYRYKVVIVKNEYFSGQVNVFEGATPYVVTLQTIFAYGMPSNGQPWGFYRLDLASSEVNLSLANYNKYLAEANAMSNDQLIAALKILYNTYDKDYQESIGNAIKTKSRQIMIGMYADFKTEMFNVHRYTGRAKYTMWCTAFQTWMIRQNGGPNVKFQRAADFYNYFGAKSTVIGIDGEPYYKEGLYAGVKAIPSGGIKHADFWLEKVTNQPYSGHSALVLQNGGGTTPPIMVNSVNGNMNYKVIERTLGFFGYEKNPIRNKNWVIIGYSEGWTKVGRYTPAP